MKKTNIDVLLVARPDHSLQIYNELVKSDIDFKYLTFKVFPEWLRKFIKNPKVICISKNVVSSKLMTLYNILYFKYRWTFLSKISEYAIFERFFRRTLSKIEPKIIHYWPKYCYKTINAIKKSNSKIRTIADIYMPNEQYVIDEMTPILEPIGLIQNIDYVKKQKEIIEKVLSFENEIIVPSEFVAETYRKFYPDKKYHVIPYGITVSPSYSRKLILNKKGVFRFVYCGTISLEKGCDLACEIISKYPEYELHLYGRVMHNESFLFEKYKNNKNIVFHGTIAKSKIQETVAQYDAGIHLSRFDAYSLAVGEIIGSGLPIIISNKTGNYIDVKENNLGIVTTLDVENIVNAIKSISNPEIYNKFIESNHQYVMSEKLSYSEKIINFYRKVLNEQRIV